MGDQLTLISPSSPAGPGSVPDGYITRAIVETDTVALGRLYYEAYEPGIACESLEEAVGDIQASMRGEYGSLLRHASLVAEREDRIVAAVMTVEQAPWPDVPLCHFIIELFTDRAHRRRGLARHLVATVLAEGGQAALRVDSFNTPALRLYTHLGFTRWNG